MLFNRRRIYSQPAPLPLWVTSHIHPGPGGPRTGPPHTTPKTGPRCNLSTNTAATYPFTQQQYVDMHTSNHQYDSTARLLDVYGSSKPCVAYSSSQSAHPHSKSTHNCPARPARCQPGKVASMHPDQGCSAATISQQPGSRVQGATQWGGCHAPRKTHTHWAAQEHRQLLNCSAPAVVAACELLPVAPLLQNPTVHWGPSLHW
jgi:hypothetical protein